MWGAASSSEDILISKASLEGLPPASAAVGGMRRFFDISVPRNIASDVNQLDGAAHVYNVDDLKEVVAANTASRQRAAREAEVLLAEEQRDFESWRDSLATVPTIKVGHACISRFWVSYVLQCIWQGCQGCRMFCSAIGKDVNHNLSCVKLLNTLMCADVLYL